MPQGQASCPAAMAGSAAYLPDKLLPTAPLPPGTQVARTQRFCLLEHLFTPTGPQDVLLSTRLVALELQPGYLSTTVLPYLRIQPPPRWLGFGHIPKA